MRLLSTTELKSVKGITFHRSHIFKLVRSGDFPQPVKLGKKRNAWVDAEIDAWVRERMALRDQLQTTDAA